MKDNWIKSKIKIAECLCKGGCNGSYDDAVLILCGALSGVASDLWPSALSPKQGIDKMRFVELMVKHSKSNPHPELISVPLLYITRSKDPLQKDNAHVIEQQFKSLNLWSGPLGTRIITCKDYHLSDKDAQSLLNGLPLQEIRKYSYAYVFYDQLRCGYVHEGKPRKMATTGRMGMSRRNPKIEYLLEDHVNIIHKICFSFDWIKEMVLSISDIYEELDADSPATKPTKWWLDG